jgi:hypothetical protein
MGGWEKGQLDGGGRKAVCIRTQFKSMHSLRLYSFRSQFLACEFRSECHCESQVYSRVDLQAM